MTTLTPSLGTQGQDIPFQNILALGLPESTDWVVPQSSHDLFRRLSGALKHRPWAESRPTTPYHSQ